MSKILILTKNLLSDQKLQTDLQRSNEQVFCSTDLMYDAPACIQVVIHFSIVIFSDTISTLEFSKYYSTFKENGLFILRNGSKENVEETEYSYLVDIVDGWINNKTSSVDVLEMISSLEELSEITVLPNLEVDDLKLQIDHFILKLSSKEKKLIHCLFAANGKTVSRQKICHFIWNEPPTNSNLSQLSSLRKRLNNKLIDSDFSGEEITTIWKAGYALTPEFISALKEGSYF